MTPTHRAEAHESELAALTAGIEEALASNCDGITAFVPVELLHGLLHELAARATPPTEPAAQPTVTPKQWQFLLDAERSLNGVLQRRIAALEAAAVPPARDVLTAIMRAAESAKEPCGMDPESPAAIRNSKFATIAHMAAQGLGMVRGPAFEAAAVPTSAAVPPDDVLEALDLSPEQFRTEGGAINRAKLRAAIRRPADYLPPEHWLRAAAVPANLQWAEAPERTQWGGGMMEALLALGKDHTLRLYAEKEALHLVPAALGAPPGTAVPVEVVKWLDEIAEMHGQWSNGIYAAHRAAKVRGWLATLQAAEPAEDHMTHAEWNRRYFPSGLTPVPDNAVPYTEPAAKKDTAA